MDHKKVMESIVKNIDCMVGMAEYPDKYFDLAVVDPPYGLGKKIYSGGTKGCKFHTLFGENKWDDEIPNDSYFLELFRVSKNQIIWGGNYFPLMPTRCLIIWDKLKGDNNFSMFELAWTSFDKPSKIYKQNSTSNNRIHPTQKPIELYSWIYTKYLPKGGNVIDTHLGSGSNRIAADKAGNIDFVGFELDKDYYEAQEKRWAEYKKQMTLW